MVDPPLRRLVPLCGRHLPNEENGQDFSLPSPALAAFVYTTAQRGFKLFLNGYPPPTCMEEEQEPGASGGGLRPEFVSDILRDLMRERFEILKNEKWTVEEKARLLGTQRDTLSAVTGT